MRMREIEGGLAIPAGSKVEMKPGGYHVMLIGLKQKLEEGQGFPLTLTFATTGELTVEVKVEKSPSHDMKDHGQAHSHQHHQKH
jgi:copper(I)-binding protein